MTLISYIDAEDVEQEVGGIFEMKILCFPSSSSQLH